MFRTGWHRSSDGHDDRQIARSPDPTARIIFSSSIGWQVSRWQQTS